MLLYDNLLIRSMGFSLTLFVDDMVFVKDSIVLRDVLGMLDLFVQNRLPLKEYSLQIVFESRTLSNFLEYLIIVHGRVTRLLNRLHLRLLLRNKDRDSFKLCLFIFFLTVIDNWVPWVPFAAGRR